MTPMTSRMKAALCAAAIGCAGLGFAASGFGDDPPAGADGGDSHLRIVKPAMEASSSSAGLGRAPDKGERAKPKKPKPPKVTNLITTEPVTVAAADEIVAELKCTKAQGIPLDGGAISPPAPAQVAISVLSRFSPNPPFDAPAGSYFVGVRNLDPLNPAQFRGTLVCAKGVAEIR